MSAPVDLSPAHLSIVERILAEHVPDCEVRAFGSRATWTAKDSSDLDLAIVGEDPLDLRTLGRLKEAFEESRLPMRVDVLDWHAVTDSFRATIESNCVVVQQTTAPPGWRRTTVGDCIPFRYGKSLRASERDSSGSIPVFGSNGVIGYHEFALTDGPTIIVGRKGTAGAVHYSPVPCWPIDTTFYVCGDDDELIRFKYYALHALDLDVMNTDSAVPGLNRAAAHSRELYVPGEHQQRAIAHVLGTLDDKIELNRRMNETLEAMARALFQDWFVDFGPTRAKIEGREPYLPPNVWALFPDRLVPSALGEIPEGWQVRTLGEIVEQVRVSENPLKTPNTMFKHFSIAAYDDHQVPRLELGKDIKSVKTRVEPGVILLSKLNPEIERVWLVDVASNDRAICSTEFIVLEPRPPFQQSYVYCLSRSSAFRSQLESLVTGTSKSHQRVPPSAALAIAGLRPTTPILDAFETGTTELLNRIASLTRENGTLIILRDTLLAKLMSESNINRDRIYG